MDQHIRKEPPRFIPSMRVVYKQLGDRSIRVDIPLGCVVHEQYDLHQRDDDHADRRRPAAVLLLVGAV